MAPLGAGEWARIVQYPDDTLAAFAVRGDAGAQTISAWISVDNGASWQGPEVLVSLPRGFGLWGGLEALVARNGAVHLFLLNDLGTGVLGRVEGEESHPEVNPGEHRLDLWHLKSSPDRTWWNDPTRIWTGYTGSLNSVVQLHSGRILLPFSYAISRTWGHRGEGLDAFTFMGTYLCTVIHSDDDGATWQLSPTPLKTPVPDITYAYGAVEPVVVELRDGRVWMLLRTQMGRFYQSFSADGARWSPPEPTEIISSDSPAGLARLTDGRLALLWNGCQRHPYAYGGRQVLHAALSDDDGRTWRHTREVARDPLRNMPPPPHGDHGTAYPFPTALRDGGLLFTTGQGEGRVLIRRLDPAWLEETTQLDDFTDGLENWSIFGTKGVEAIPHPKQAGRSVLRLRRVDPEFSACVVRDIPQGDAGCLQMRYHIESGSHGATLLLTDHFSPPFDAEDHIHCLFDFALPNHVGWHDVELIWDLRRRQATLRIDQQEDIQIRPLRRESAGVSYVRLRTTFATPESGALLIDTLRVDITRP